MIVVWILLQSGDQIIHQALGRNFHPPPGGIAIGEIITPLVIGFLGDLALPQRIGCCLPFVQHSNPQVAKHYLRVDMNGLRKCVLEVEVKTYVKE